MLRIFVSDDSSPRYDVKHACKVGLWEKGLMTSYLGDESSDTKILSTALYIFRLENGSEIRLGLSITVPEKKKKSDSRVKKVTWRFFYEIQKVTKISKLHERWQKKNWSNLYTSQIMWRLAGRSIMRVIKRGRIEVAFSHALFSTKLISNNIIAAHM